MKSIDGLLRQMIEKGSSDLHLVVERPPLFRLRGELVESGEPKLTPERSRELIAEILTADQRAHVD